MGWHLCPEVRDGLLHLQHQVPEVAGPQGLGVLRGGSRGVPGALARLPDAAGGETGKQTGSVAHTHTTGPRAPGLSGAQDPASGWWDIPAQGPGRPAVWTL